MRPRDRRRSDPGRGPTPSSTHIPQAQPTANPDEVEYVQLALQPDTGRARHDDPETSVAAAQAVRVALRMAEVRGSLERLQEATSAEISNDLEARGIVMLPNTVSRRLTDLGRANEAVRIGKVPGDFGRLVTKWRIVR